MYINNFNMSAIYDRTDQPVRYLVRAFDSNDNIITSALTG